MPSDYKNREYILDGVTHGFSLIDGEHLQTIEPVRVGNHRSAFINRPAVEKQIREELSKGNYKLFSEKPHIISPIGAIPKGEDKIRLIHDASLPEGRGANSLMTDCDCTYMDIREAQKHIQLGDYIAKVDLKNAYRSVNVHPSNYTFMGLAWKFQGETRERFMVDTKLPFGASKSPKIFQTLSEAVCSIMWCRFAIRVIAYLDDFLVITRTKQMCAQALRTLIFVLRRLGFDINWKKVDGPSTILTFLGVEINTERMALSLPAVKCKQFLDLLQQFQTRQRASKRQLESLIGKLSWASQVIQGGRTFIRRLLNVKNSLLGKHHMAKLDIEFRLDIQWWCEFMLSFNGSRTFVDRAASKIIYTDACVNGAGGYLEGDYRYWNWKTDCQCLSNEHINVKEIAAVVLSVNQWGSALQNKKVVIYTDNVTCKAAINKGTAKNRVAMELIRQLFWMQAMWNIDIKAIYLEGSKNRIADTVSRLDEAGKLSLLYELLPSLSLSPFCVTEMLKHMSLSFIACRWGLVPEGPPEET